MITERHLEVRKTLISLCQTYSLVISEMLEKPADYGLDIGTEDEILSRTKLVFDSIENGLKLGEYDAESITANFAEAQHTFKIMMSTRNPSALASDAEISSVKVAQDYTRTYNLYILNAIKANLIDIEKEPARYLTKITLEDIQSLLKETDLLLAMQDKYVIGEEMMAARMAELTYVYLYEVVTSIKAKLNMSYEFHMPSENQ